MKGISRFKLKTGNLKRLRRCRMQRKVRLWKVNIILFQKQKTIGQKIKEIGCTSFIVRCCKEEDVHEIADKYLKGKYNGTPYKGEVDDWEKIPLV